MTVAADLASQWQRKRLKYCASYNDEVLSEETDALEQIDYVEISDVSLADGIQQTTLMPFYQAPSRARRKVRSGDILISTVRTYLKAIAAVDRAPDNLIASTGFCVVRPHRGLDSSFAGWAVRSDQFVGEVVSRSVGVSYPAINASQLVDIEILLPPLETQRRIAAFLDNRVGRIDALISKKQALLDCLAEKRQAIITQAVTKGLHPTAPMKDSGIDWLGQIPAHWEVKKLKYLVRESVGLQMGPFGGMLTELAAEPTGFKLYGQENTIAGDFALGHRWISEERYRSLARYHLRAGDLVITRKGSLGSCRRFPSDALPGVADSDTIIIRFDETKLLSALAIMLLHDAAYVAAQIESNRRGAILAGLNSTVVGDLLIVCPSITEQAEIIAQCGGFMSRIDRLSDAVEDSIQQAMEYRSALITAAVTGQIEGLQ
jgi:type I restriction enzyme S subunit